MNLLNPMDDDQLDAIIEGLERIKELEAKVARLRLTDAEREAVAWMLRHAAYAADVPAFLDSGDYRLHHDALRGLLERLK